MQDSQHTLSLESILTFAHDKMQQLLIVLKKEAVLLKENNIEELGSITLEKITLTEQIENNEQQRIHFLSQRSLDANEPSQWLYNNKLLSIWNKIKTISEQAQKQNQINGIVINGSRRRAQTQIEILSTSAPAVELTYSASGENIKQRDSNSLAHV